MEKEIIEITKNLEINIQEELSMIKKGDLMTSVIKSEGPYTVRICEVYPCATKAKCICADTDGTFYEEYRLTKLFAIVDHPHGKMLLQQYLKIIKEVQLLCRFTMNLRDIKSVFQTFTGKLK